MQQVIEGYAAAAPELIDRFKAVSSSDLFKPVVDLLPLSGVRVVDMGAGPGRDAAWLASMGHTVLAVEPVKEFRDAGMAADPLSKIDWIDDKLPDLDKTKRRGPFDLVLLCAVWQHLDDRQRLVAMRSLSELTTPDGLVIMSLRHGQGSAERTVYPIAPEETVDAASKAGFTLLRRVETESAQPANRKNGVRWTWLALVRR
ncbi:MAG TPA: methyltransferase domain-containing protein [Terriglobales bacterium]